MQNDKTGFTNNFKWTSVLFLTTICKKCLKIVIHACIWTLKERLGKLLLCVFAVVLQGTHFDDLISLINEFRVWKLTQIQKWTKDDHFLLEQLPCPQASYSPNFWFLLIEIWGVPLLITHPFCPWPCFVFVNYLHNSLKVRTYWLHFDLSTHYNDHIYLASGSSVLPPDLLFQEPITHSQPSFVTASPIVSPGLQRRTTRELLVRLCTSYIHFPYGP